MVVAYFCPEAFYLYALFCLLAAFLLAPAFYCIIEFIFSTFYASQAPNVLRSESVLFASLLSMNLVTFVKKLSLLFALFSLQIYSQFGNGIPT